MVYQSLILFNSRRLLIKKIEMKKNKNIKKIALATAMVGLLTVGGITAYFTDSATVTNKFTVGEVSLDLTEPSWVPSTGTNITPNKEVAKDPTITNSGKNSEFVFMTVAVPYANVITATADGAKNAAADTELYSYTVNAGWVEIGTPTKDTTAKTVTHTYAYGSSSACSTLAVGAKTPALFNTVKFANVIEGQGLEGTAKDIVINAYGIQSTDINGKKTAPTDVWSVFKTQNPSAK